MSQHDDRQVERRAELLPEEQRTGSDDAHTQAEVILADSAYRTEHPEDAAEQSTQSLPDRPD